jgi:lipopolysaccharide transport system permease protein
MELVIKPKNKLWQIDSKELWQFRDLFYFLTWRDVKVKYKQTVIGILWAIFQPFITMVVFSIFFGKFVGVPSDGAPYPIFVYAGLVFWMLFSSGLTSASGAFVSNERILTKIYFPRIILPISSILTNVVDFLIATIILFGMMVYFKYTPNMIGLLILPVLALMTIFSTLGIGLLFGSLNVKYRDVRYVLPFFIQILIFITPVIYPVSIVSERFRWILYVNPMTGVIDVARSTLLGNGVVEWSMLFISIAAMVVYCILGFFYFKKTERYFADVI